MHQPPTEPSRAVDPRGGTLTMDQVIKIVTVATRQLRESLEEQRAMIECALNQGLKLIIVPTTHRQGTYG